MPDISEEELKKWVSEAVRGAMHSECPLSDPTKEEVGHFFGRLKDIGGGNLNVGIERASKAIAWLSTVREFGSMLGGKIAIIVVLAVLGTGSVIFMRGFWVWLSEMIIKK